MDSDLLLRYAASDVTPDEAAAVRAWAAADPAHERELRVVTAAWAALDQPAPGTPGDWQRVAARVGAEPRHHDRRGWLGRAAILLVAAGAALFMLVQRGADAPVAAWSTGVGETRAAVLPDGSVVRLGPASELRIVAGFDSVERRVVLRGTAHFSVRRAEPRRFVVRAGAVETSVLGTEFVVRAYDNEDVVDVGVIEGRVAVNAPADDDAQLDTGERARVTMGRIHVERGNITALTAWTERRLVFRDATLAEAARELERWYDVEVEIAGVRLEERRITLSVQAAPLNEVLELMRTTLDVDIVREGRTVIIRGGRR